MEGREFGAASLTYADLYVHGWNGDVALVEATLRLPEKG
jgi:hypothetical protein